MISNKKGRKLIAAIAAAALSAVIIGTSVTASGIFERVFGDYIKAQDTDGAFTTVNVQGESNDLNVICGAVTGDDRFAYTELTITRKDGVLLLTAPMMYFYKTTYMIPQIISLNTRTQRAGIPIQLDYKINIPLIHHSKICRVDISDMSNINTNDLDISLSSITATPYRICITASFAQKNTLRHIARENGLSNFSVETENGETVQCCLYGIVSNDAKQEFTIQLDYNEKKGSSGKVITLAPDKIKSIYIGKTKIY